MKGCSHFSVWAMVALLMVTTASAQGEPAPDRIAERTSSELLRTTSGEREIAARFHLGKGWCKELREFPADNSRLLIVEMTITNGSSTPVFLYLDQIWLHIDEEDQLIEFAHAEDIGPRVYRNPYATDPNSPTDISGPVTVIGTPGTREGEMVDPRGNVGGVFIDLKKIGKSGAPPMSLEKFVYTMFENEFNQTYLKPGDSASGFLYFHLPWSFKTLSPMQLHLEDVFGEPENIQITLQVKH
ncbi:MAG: hypothetical protein JXQ27_17445 [Acidobacteria bacterium]|nr:hypothetical protein [Acidobacteriota bacterium]